MERTDIDMTNEERLAARELRLMKMIETCRTPMRTKELVKEFGICARQVNFDIERINEYAPYIRTEQLPDGKRHVTISDQPFITRYQKAPQKAGITVFNMSDIDDLKKQHGFKEWNPTSNKSAKNHVSGTTLSMAV
jgi:hypothetical protein